MGKLPDTINRTLIQAGYTPNLFQGQLVFDRSYEINGYYFPIRITDIDPEFIQLPDIFLQGIPDGLGHQLPHRSTSGHLCYLDNHRAELDLFAPEESILTILAAVRRLLHSYAHKEQLPEEFADEFLMYWGSEDINTCFLRSLTVKGDDLIAELFEMPVPGQEETHKECVVGTADQIRDWKRLRGALPDSGQQLNALVLNISEPPLINTNLYNWPPKTFSALLQWLSEINQRYVQYLVDQISNRRYMRLMIVITTPSGHVGVAVELSQKWHNFTTTLKRKQNKRVKHKGRLLREHLMREDSTESMVRFHVEDATDEHILTRNQPHRALPLAGKRIALIGCGTIGGYLADLLQKTGAGAGEGALLQLYDGQSLNTENIGRHVLGPGYIGLPKCYALKQYLERQAVAPITIVVDTIFRNEMLVEQEWDLVIDATGFERFSNSLTYTKHHNAITTPVLHVWIDAWGQAVRALLDDNRGACYRCLKQGVGIQAKQRFELGEIDNSVERVARYCGQSYTPFSTSASVQAASMALQMAQACLAGEFFHRFQHLSLHHKIKHQKNNNPKPTKHCPCCQQKT